MTVIMFSDHHTQPDHPSEELAEGRWALKAVKALCGLISSPILDLCHHKICTKEVVKNS
jgi:hypothetical protein